jgi:hypothetical protein
MHVLTEESQKHILRIAENEVMNHTCIAPHIPLYQSYDDMHVKYSDDSFMSAMIGYVSYCVNQKNSYVIKSCWFNKNVKESKYEWHSHLCPITAVLYLKNCENAGTLFLCDDVELQMKCEDNMLVIFNGSILHKIPTWDGRDRYTVAFDFMPL